VPRQYLLVLNDPPMASSNSLPRYALEREREREREREIKPLLHTMSWFGAEFEHTNAQYPMVVFANGIARV
jgi:hypothetical protein